MSNAEQSTSEARDAAMERYAERLRHEAEWLAGLKVDDEVSLYNGWHHQVTRITKVTPTQIHIGPHKFRRKDRREIGGTRWSRVSLQEVTQDIRDEIERTRLLNAVSDIAWESVSTEVLRSVLAMVKS